ncbi:SGNH/GDSL hydrolase family protein [Rhizobium ruizarguesonis]|uniref:SGNH/GDSL hydrolase family protein n=1 Tax=Rhizobium ruizarguesonis TaxID=2081791 RepID=UPI0004014F4C|nr:SGNH/GDSL hydrolase family protein [Rhizobium ruizarguesonis]QJS27463.1 SGNH/GDSL hydrolase family protein [Rhizobium leguminosarum bv. trifolii TA1]UFW96217.1 SGNH/GDSL hydrolase family protein [Rhizobium ruizarguesonis]
MALSPNLIAALVGAGVIAQGGQLTLAIRPIANRTKQTWATAGGSDGVNTYGKYLSRHKVNKGGCFGQFGAAYCNRRSEAVGFNSITVSARYRYPSGTGNWVDATFGGNPSVTLANNASDVWIDPINLPMSENAYFDEEVTVNVVSAGQKWPTLERVSLAAANGEGSLLSTSPIAGTPTPLDTTEFYGAVAFRGLSTAPRAVAVFSDSIGNGNFDDPTRDRIGFIQRKFGDLFPVLQVGTGGELASDWLVSHSKRLALALASGCTDAWVPIGTNDIGPTDYATMRTRLSAMIAVLAGAGFAVSALPILTVTVGNISTPKSGYEVGGVADQLNAYFQYLASGGGGLLSGFIDTRPGWQNAANQILSAAYTDDFLHPNVAGHAAVAAGIVGGLPASLPAAPIPPAFWTASATYLRAESLKALYADGAAVTAWSDIDNTMTAVEATNAPILDYDGAPNAKAALLISGNKRLVAPAGGPGANIFATDGLMLIAYKAATTGGGGFGRLYEVGAERIGQADATRISTNLDYSTTDATQNITSSFNVWHCLAQRYQSGVYPPAVAFDSFSFVNSVTPAGSPVDNSASPFYIANAATNNRALDGAIAGIAWFKGASLSEDQIAAAIAYFRADTGVVLL